MAPNTATHSHRSQWHVNLTQTWHLMELRQVLIKKSGIKNNEAGTCLVPGLSPNGTRHLSTKCMRHVYPCTTPSPPTMGHKGPGVCVCVCVCVRVCVRACV